MTATPYARPGIDVLTGARQAHVPLTAATRRVALALSVTFALVRPYALTVGALVCFTIAGFITAPALGFTVAGACGLLLNHALERERGA